MQISAYWALRPRCRAIFNITAGGVKVHMRLRDQSDITKMCPIIATINQKVAPDLRLQGLDRGVRQAFSIGVVPFLVLSDI